MRLRRKRYVPRKDRLVNSMETALNSENFRPHILPSTETRYSVHVTADKKRKRKERKIVWTTKAPPTAHLGPQDIMSKPGSICAKAQAAKSHVDLWSLFFTPEMVTKICAYTNTKIEEDIVKKGFTKEDLATKSHIKPIDEVKVIPVRYL